MKERLCWCGRKMLLNIFGYLMIIVVSCIIYQQLSRVCSMLELFILWMNFLTFLFWCIPYRRSEQEPKEHKKDRPWMIIYNGGVFIFFLFQLSSRLWQRYYDIPIAETPCFLDFLYY